MDCHPSGNPALSHAYADTGTTQAPRKPRKGTRTSRGELVIKANELYETHKSYGKVARIMGHPKSRVWDLINK